MDAVLAVISSVLTVLSFVAGLFFGAWLQRRVSMRLDVKLPTGGRSSVQAEPDGGYESPYRGHDL